MIDQSLTNQNKVLILLATFNRAHLVKETLESIKNQTYKDWECIIVDDYSTDKTAQVIKKYINDDPRFSFFKKNEKYAKGLSGSRNYGLDLATEREAKYVQFFDDDDIVHPQNLEISMSEISTEGYDFCHFIRHAFKDQFVYNFELGTDYKSIELNETNIFDIISGRIRFNSCQILWNINTIGNERFNESLHYAEEWEFYTRILSKGFRGISVDKVLYYARKHSESNTGEFWKGSDLRESSNLLAVNLVIDHLSKKQLLSKRMRRHFFQLSVFFKERSILQNLISKTSSRNERIKYRIYYEIYPIMSFAYKKKMWLKSLLNLDS